MTGKGGPLDGSNLNGSQPLYSRCSCPHVHSLKLAASQASSLYTYIPSPTGVSNAAHALHGPSSTATPHGCGSCPSVCLVDDVEERQCRGGSAFGNRSLFQHDPSAPIFLPACLLQQATCLHRLPQPQRAGSYSVTNPPSDLLLLSTRCLKESHVCTCACA